MVFLMENPINMEIGRICDEWEFRILFHGGTLVPYISQYFKGIYPLKFRPEK
jgi:hypothetical protein